jgi:hypothetical protein
MESSAYILNFKLLQGTGYWMCLSHKTDRHPREGGDPVRRGFSVQSLLSLGYWIVRLSLSSGAHSRDPLADDDNRT